MDFLRTACWVITYLGLTLVLPIVTASRFLYKRKRSTVWIMGVAVVSLAAGAVGFWMALVATSHLVPPGHDLIFNTNGLVVGLLLGFLVGVPVGTWSGAWGTAGLVYRYR